MKPKEYFLPMHVGFQAPNLLFSSFKRLLVLRRQTQPNVFDPKKKTHKCLHEFGLSPSFIFLSFSFWDIQNCGLKSPGNVIHSTASQGSLLILKGEISSVPQRLVNLSPLEVNGTFVKACIFLPKKVTIYIAPKWKGSTANSQIASAGELEQFDWWSKGVRKSFCTHQKGAVCACPPGASVSQALLHCPRLNKLCFMMVLNPSSSFHGIKKIIKNIAWIFADSLPCWQLSLVLSFAFAHCRQRQLSPTHSSSSVVGAAVVQKTVGQGLEREIVSCAGIIQTLFLLCLFLWCFCWAQRAASKGWDLQGRNPYLSLVPGLPGMRDRPWSSRALSKSGGLHWS